MWELNSFQVWWNSSNEMRPAGQKGTATLAPRCQLLLSVQGCTPAQICYLLTLKEGNDFHMLQLNFLV